VPFASAPSRCEAVLTDRLDGFLHLNFTLSVAGAFELPLLRVPLEFDWSER